MSMPKRMLLVCTAMSLGMASAFAQSAQQPPVGLGKPISEADIKAWDVAIMPDGKGLPPGKGTGAEGAKIYAQKCTACHGEGGLKPVAPGAGPLAGGQPLTNGIDTAKTIGNFWGHSTTVFDFVRRAMPFNQPRTLSNDEVYSLTAYLLSINKIIGENEVINAETLPKVKMPNADNFIIRFPDRI